MVSSQSQSVDMAHPAVPPAAGSRGIFRFFLHRILPPGRLLQRSFRWVHPSGWDHSRARLGFTQFVMVYSGANDGLLLVLVVKNAAYPSMLDG